VDTAQLGCRYLSRQRRGDCLFAPMQLDRALVQPSVHASTGSRRGRRVVVDLGFDGPYELGLRLRYRKARQGNVG